MFELPKTEEVRKLIAVTKSDSGISGVPLVKAHIRLGSLLAERIELPPEDTTLVAIMRGGIFFALGMYLHLNCQLQTYDPKHEPFIRPKTKHVILVDSVINTGKTITPILEPDMLVACCVIQESAVPLFDTQLLTVRTSKNSFVGSDTRVQVKHKGPDTTMRLFHLL